MAILETKDLRKIYGSGENEVHALDGVSISVDEGEFVAVVGTSGSGKSTLLNMIGGLDRPTSGSVTIRGKELLKMKDEELTIFRRRNIGFVFQNYNLLPVLNVYENIVYPIEIDGAKADTEFVRQIIHTLGLEKKLKNMPNNLSGGQQQRVAIARALATNPKILLCDEATSALDPTTTRSILALLKEINKTLGITIIVITHEMAVIEEICQRVAIIDSSRIAEVGTVDEVFTRPKSAMAKQLIYPDGKRNSLATGKRYCRIVFDGNSSFEPVVSNMVLECKAPVNIMFADTKNIDGKAYGQMILQLPEDERAAKRALAYLETQNVHAEEVADYASV